MQGQQRERYKRTKEKSLKWQTQKRSWPITHTVCYLCRHCKSSYALAGRKNVVQTTGCVDVVPAMGLVASTERYRIFFSNILDDANSVGKALWHWSTQNDEGPEAFVVWPVSGMRLDGARGEVVVRAIALSLGVRLPSWHPHTGRNHLEMAEWSHIGEVARTDILFYNWQCMPRSRAIADTQHNSVQTLSRLMHLQIARTS